MKGLRAERLDREGALIALKDRQGGAFECVFWCVGFKFNEEWNFAGDKLENLRKGGDFGMIFELRKVGECAIFKVFIDASETAKIVVMKNHDVAVFEEM